MRGWLGLGVGLLAYFGVIAVDPQRSAIHGDGYYTYLWARSIVFDHDLDFANDYAVCPDPWGMADMPHGRAMNQWNPGAALFFIPVLLFDILTHHPAFDSEDPKIAHACVGPLAERAVRGTIGAALLVLILGFFVAQRVASPGLAAIASGSVLLGTPIVHYVTAMPSYSHGASAAFSGLFVWLWIRGRTCPWRAQSFGFWLGLGGALGLAMLARPQNLVIGVLALWEWVERAPWFRSFENWVRHFGRAALFVVGVLLGFGLQIYQWWSSYGEPLMVPQGDYYLRLDQPRIAHLLFSTANGLFVWCPLTYLALGGLLIRVWRKEEPKIALPLLLAFALVTYINACVADWWGGVSFSTRRFDTLAVPFAYGVAASLSEIRALLMRRITQAAGAAGALVATLLSGWGALGSVAVQFGFPSHVALPSERIWSDLSGRFQRSLLEAVGNPLAWPASIPFALFYGVHPRLWDHVSMPEFFFHRWLTLEAQPDLIEADFIGAHAPLAVDFAHPVDGWRAPLQNPARIFLPVSYPFIGAIKLRLRSRPALGQKDVLLKAYLDEEFLGELRVEEGIHAVDFRVRKPHDGILVLRLETQEGQVEISALRFLDREPTPFEVQARRNARIRARRLAWRKERGLP
ncbi:MAG: hypothetical protein N2515_04830 [Deltaproteobacteria bacterium]|nr:hypothetical protein [Deltaproteobacteria bacterium]